MTGSLLDPSFTYGQAVAFAAAAWFSFLAVVAVRDMRRNRRGVGRAE